MTSAGATVSARGVLLCSPDKARLGDPRRQTGQDRQLYGPAIPPIRFDDDRRIDMLIELTRLKTDDDGVETMAPIAVNPTMVAAVFASAQSESATVIRLADGRGFMIHGSYEDVMTALAGGTPNLDQRQAGTDNSEAVN
jgi:hypothetical protein